jgi:hypothetical protein
LPPVFERFANLFLLQNHHPNYQVWLLPYSGSDRLQGAIIGILPTAAFCKKTHRDMVSGARSHPSKFPVQAMKKFCVKSLGESMGEFGSMD